MRAPQPWTSARLRLAAPLALYGVGKANEQVGGGDSAALCRRDGPLPTSAFRLTAQTPVLSFLEPISLGAVVDIGLVVGIVVCCWVRPNRDFKTS